MTRPLATCKPQHLRCALLSLGIMGGMALAVAFTLGLLPKGGAFSCIQTPSRGALQVEDVALHPATAVPAMAKNQPVGQGSSLAQQQPALLAFSSVLALALVVAGSRSRSLVTMFGKHDHRTFRGKLFGHKFGKYRMKKQAARRLKKMRNGTFDPAEVVQTGQPEPLHGWDTPTIFKNQLWYQGRQQALLDAYEVEIERQREFYRKNWKGRYGICGPQYYYKDWSPPEGEMAQEVAAAVVSAKVSAADVKDLRSRSGAGILDCQKALKENDGDMDKAMEWLRKKGISKADKKAGNLAAEGNITSYVHFNSKIAVLVEINSETDFVASNAIFKEYASDVAMQIASNPSVAYVSVDDVPEDVMAREKELEMGKEDLADKPENIREKMVVGRLKKKFEERALLGQTWIKDESKTVQEVLKERISKLGENIVIRRFVRLNLGEGLEKKDVDFAAGVEKELAKFKDAAGLEPPKPVEEKPKQEAPKEQAAPAAEGPKITAAQVKDLRQRSGAGIMDTKKALTACAGDVEKAMEWLKKKGISKADKKAGNLSVEGAIASYVHFNSKLGVIVEVNSETDFVAMNSIFKEFAQDVAMQIAANPEVSYVSVENVPADVMAREREVEMAKEDLAGKPDDIRAKIVEGRLKKQFGDRALLGQKWLKDEDKTVQDAVKETIAKLGENIVIRRFERLVLGEGLEKKDDDFAAGVEKELAKYR